MNVGKILVAASAVVATLFAVDFIVRKAGGDIAESIADINVDTPFEGGGIIGTAGNITDMASGGTLSTFGSWLGLQGSKTINWLKTGSFRGGEFK